jgi:hypothetical protein
MVSPQRYSARWCSKSCSKFSALKRHQSLFSKDKVPAVVAPG